MSVTFIIPVFNAEATIAACLNSIIAQKGVEWNCICIDDDSCDRSLSLIKEYVDKDPRINVLCQPHGGVAAARNLGISHTSGDYVWFVDADDTIAPDSLIRLSKESADVILLNLPPSFDRAVGNVLAWNALYKRELIKDLKFPNLINHEDIVFGAAAFCKAQTVASVHGDFYRHVNRPDSADNSHSFRRIADACRMMPLFWKACAPASGFRARCSVVRKLCAHFILHILMILPRTLKTFFSAKTFA